MRLDKEKAYQVFDEKIAAPLGLSVEEAAFGVYRIATAQITDLVREITVERGLDPRDFVMHSFGGSCGMVCGMFGAELNVKSMVIPYTASVNCAFGLVSADIVHQFSVVSTLPIPSPAQSLNKLFEPMVQQALDVLLKEGFSGDTVELELAADLRYSRQVHELTTPIRGQLPLNEESLKNLADDFEASYERKYGKGSAYREAGIEMTQFRLTARGLMKHPDASPSSLSSKNSSVARVGRRPIFVDSKSAMVESDIFDFNLLASGNIVDGPAVIHTPITTIVLQTDQRATVDQYRNVLVNFV